MPYLPSFFHAAAKAIGTVDIPGAWPLSLAHPHPCIPQGAVAEHAWRDRRARVNTVHKCQAQVSPR